MERIFLRFFIVLPSFPMIRPSKSGWDFTLRSMVWSVTTSSIEKSSEPRMFLSKNARRSFIL